VDNEKNIKTQKMSTNTEDKFTTKNTKGKVIKPKKLLKNNLPPSTIV
jgi:hypothetical protein